ncbi:MAG: RND family transporter [Nitrospinaceae bacterium]
MKLLLKWCFKNITCEFPGTILALAILLSLLSIKISSELKYNPRMDNLLPQELDLIKEFNEVVSKTGGSGPLVLVLEGIGQKDAPRIIRKLTQELEKIPGVRYVDSQIPMNFLDHRQLYLISRQDLLALESLLRDAVEYARNLLTELFPEEGEPFNPKKFQTLSDEYHFFDEINPYYKGRKQINYFIFVQPRGTVTNTDFTSSFVHSIQQAIQSLKLDRHVPGLRINLTGSLMVRLEENQIIVRDLKKSVLLAAFLTTLIIILYTRSGFSIPLIIVPLMLSLTYTFALTQLIIGHVNIISGFLVAILMGLGIDYGIHLYIRFKQELLKGHPIPRALELVMTQVGRSSVIAMLTTIGVFSILIFSEFKGFSEFGKIAVLGIVSAFITYYFVFPAQVLFYDKIHWLRKPRPRMFTLNISNLYSSTPYFLAGLFIITLACSLFLIPGLQFEYDFQKLRGDSPAADYETKTTEDFGFAFSPTVILTPKKENLFYIHQALEKIKKSNGEISTLGQYYSLNLFSKKEYEFKKDVLERIRKFFLKEKNIIRLSLGEPRFQKLQRLVLAKPFDEAAIPKTLVNKFTAQDEYMVLVYSPADKNFFDVRNIYQLENEIKALKENLAQKDISTSILNENLLAAEILDWVKLKGPRAMGMAMGLVLMILILDLQSVRLAVKTFLPLITGLALTGALMSVFHVKLNFINFVMLPSIVGIMIDHCIYLGHHILDYPEGGTLRSVKETGSAILLSALTSLAGYASLNIASHAGIRSIATVVELGIITCTICALFMLPALFDLGTHKHPFSLWIKRIRPKPPNGNPR